MSEGIGSFPEIPVQDADSQSVDQHWGHDKAEDMADALKHGAGVGPANRYDFDSLAKLNKYRSEDDPSLDRRELNNNLARWSSKALEPLSKIYDRDPERFASMPTQEFMDMANKILSLETRSGVVKAKLEELREQVAVAEAGLERIERELQAALYPEQQSASSVEAQE